MIAGKLLSCTLCGSFHALIYAGEWSRQHDDDGDEVGDILPSTGGAVIAPTSSAAPKKAKAPETEDEMVSRVRQFVKVCTCICHPHTFGADDLLMTAWNTTNPQ